MPSRPVRAESESPPSQSILAAAMAARGLSVGVLDADIHGHSIPRMMGTTDRPTQVESMILPPIAHEVKVISIAQFTEGNTPVVWRGPMLHRALQQFLADVYWGDLDVLLLDLPPGTGDIAISVAQLIPNAEILGGDHAAAGGGRGRRTGRQHRAADPSAHRRRRGEHVRAPACRTAPRCRSSAKAVASRSPSGCPGRPASTCPCWAQIPLDPALVTAGDAGTPIVLSAPDSSVGKALNSVADSLSSRRRGLAGVSLGLDPTKH